jgi:hypothetical protein
MQQLQFSILSTGLCITAIDGTQVSLSAAEAFELADFIQTNRKALYTMLREAAGAKEKIILVDTDAFSAPTLCQQIMSYLALGRQEITTEVTSRRGVRGKMREARDHEHASDRGRQDYFACCTCRSDDRRVKSMA